MGPQKSKPNLHSSSNAKILTIYVPGSKLKIQITNESLTISRLITSLNQKYSSRYPIISLKTLNNYEVLDYWLSLPEKIVQPLENDDDLIAIFYTPVPKKICCSNFDILKIIGRGAYSIVTQTRKKDTGMIYAMKSIEKELALKESSLFQLLAEKEILSDVNHPFVAKMH